MKKPTNEDMYADLEKLLKRMGNIGLELKGLPFEEKYRVWLRDFRTFKAHYGYPRKYYPDRALWVAKMRMTETDDILTKIRGYNETLRKYTYKRRDKVWLFLKPKEEMRGEQRE